MCEIHKGIIVCSHGSINVRQASNEWMPARLKMIREQEAEEPAAPSPDDSTRKDQS
jgi:hypothetical protein